MEKFTSYGLDPGDWLLAPIQADVPSSNTPYSAVNWDGNFVQQEIPCLSLGRASRHLKLMHESPSGPKWQLANLDSPAK